MRTIVVKRSSMNNSVDYLYALPLKDNARVLGNDCVIIVRDADYIDTFRVQCHRRPRINENHAFLLNTNTGKIIYTYRLTVSRLLKYGYFDK